MNNYDATCSRSFEVTQGMLTGSSTTIKARCHDPYGRDLGWKSFNVESSALKKLKPGDQIEWQHAPAQLTGGMVYRGDARAFELGERNGAIFISHTFPGGVN